MKVNDYSNPGSSKLPLCLPGYSHIHRHWDDLLQLYVAEVRPGDFYVTNHSNEVIMTLLGSCVSACIRDKKIKVGGMNHFMLPLKGSVYHSKFTNPLLSTEARYGNWAMEYLINEILKHGGTRRNLEIKVFGGSNMLKKMTDVGDKNIKFILEYIYNENLTLMNHDLGGVYPRKILYYPCNGIVKVKKIVTEDIEGIVKEEKDYFQQIKGEKFTGTTELFKSPREEPKK